MRKILIVGMIFILIGGVFCGAAYAAGEKYTESKMGDITSSFDADGVSKINIRDHVAQIRILKAEKNSGILVKAENVSETGFKCEQSGNTLNISYNPNTIKFGFLSLPAFVAEPFWSNNNPVITIYIPDDKLFEELHFGGGVGDVEIERIQAKSFVIDGGLGSYDVKDIYAESLKIRGGVGDAKIGGTIFGDIKIDGGVGSVMLNLKGELSDYNIKANSGIGDVSVNGKRPSENSRGIYTIRIDGGVGDVNININ